MSNGWAKKILDKKIELLGKKAENNFLKNRLQVFLEFPVSKILSIYPDFFDNLLLE